MKRKLLIILSASTASVLAFSALAQGPPPRPDRPDYARDRVPPAPRMDRLNGAAKASELIGMAVNNYQNEKLGKVEDLAMDLESGRIIQVILSTGGFAGHGDTLRAVPPGALHHDVALRVLHLDADQAKLKGAPKFEMSRWAEYSDSEHLSGVYRHYGQEPAFTFVQRDAGRRDGYRNPESAPNTVSTRKADGTWDKDRISDESQSMIPASRLGQLQKASKLIGTPVRNRQDEKLGRVENIIVDMPSGRILAVIVSSGRFLRMGGELSAVPPVALRFTANRDALQLDASREVLSSAPHFKSNQWPDFARPGYADGIYRAYRVEPYFTTDAPAEPDNSRRNVRAREDRPPAPLDRRNPQADLDTTKQIRKEIISGRNLSANARNVRITTTDGRVTLHGPVNTAEEKRRLGEIADRVARPGNVDNQLEVNFQPQRLRSPQ
jgi:hyperosmotically inducible periplasmic protein